MQVRGTCHYSRDSASAAAAVFKAGLAIIRAAPIVIGAGVARISVAAAAVGTTTKASSTVATKKTPCCPFRDDYGCSWRDGCGADCPYADPPGIRSCIARPAPQHDREAKPAPQRACEAKREAALTLQATRMCWCAATIRPLHNGGKDERIIPPHGCDDISGKASVAPDLGRRHLVNDESLRRQSNQNKSDLQDEQIICGSGCDDCSPECFLGHGRITRLPGYGNEASLVQTIIPQTLTFPSQGICPPGLFQNEGSEHNGTPPPPPPPP